MELNDLIQMLTDGLPADQAATVRAAIERDTVKSRVTTLKQEREYQALVESQAALQRSIDGQPDKNEVGYKAYKDWYDKNFEAAKANHALLTKYMEKHGNLDAPPQNPGGGGAVAGLSEADVMRLIQEKILPNYAPANTVVRSQADQMKVLQRHFLAGRKTPIDVDNLMKTAGEKYNGNLEQAYDEWDKPEREKAAKLQTDAEVDRRVKEELQKRGASANFPSGADMTAGALSARTKEETSKFDRTSLNRDLAQTWLNGGEESTS